MGMYDLYEETRWLAHVGWHTSASFQSGLDAVQVDTTIK